VFAVVADVRHACRKWVINEAFSWRTGRYNHPDGTPGTPLGSWVFPEEGRRCCSHLYIRSGGRNIKARFCQSETLTKHHVIMEAVCVPVNHVFFTLRCSSSELRTPWLARQSRPGGWRCFGACLASSSMSSTRCTTRMHYTGVARHAKPPRAIEAKLINIHSQLL